MKIRTIARAAMIRLAILAGILVAATLFINLPWFDQELHEDLLQLTKPRDVPMDGNAYPLVVGFLAAEDRDPRDMGLQIIQAQREYFRANGHTSMPLDQTNKLLRDQFTAPTWSKILKSNSCNSRIELDCADRMVEEVAAAPINDARVRLLLARFERVLDEPRFEETQEFDFHMLPNYGPLLTTSRIRLAESFREADSSRTLQVIGEDVRFWKRMLDGEQTLIAKMVALAGLKTDTMYLSALIRVRQLDEAALRQIPVILAPLTESERNIEETFMAELRLGLLSEQGFRAVTGAGSLSRRLLSQDNATVNEYYTTLTLPLRLRASLSAAAFYRQKSQERVRFSTSFMPTSLYNLVGKQYVRIAVALALDPWQNYIARVHDVDGRIALVLLQSEIELNGGGSVEEAVKASRYRNPYTGQPMDYDSKAGTISFPCLATVQEVCALRIRMPSPARSSQASLRDAQSVS
jgi:hypothetical protein